MNNPEYQKYLLSEHWRSLRWRLFKAKGHKCEACREEGGEIDAHHLIYRHPLNTGRVLDLMVLCRAFHRSVHAGMRPYPDSYSVDQRRTHTIHYLGYGERPVRQKLSDDPWIPPSQVKRGRRIMDFAGMKAGAKMI